MARPAPLGLQTVALPRFRGTNLRDQPDGLALGQALDTLNVELTEIGGVRRRPGTQVFDSAVRGTTVAYVAPMAISGARRLLESSATAVYAVDSSGVQQHTAAVTATISSVTRFGGPNSPRNYLANGTDTLRRYDSGGFTAPTCTLKDLVAGTQATAQAMPKGALVCAWPNEERLLVGGFGTGGTDGPGGQPSGPEYVWITEPGDPETFAKTSYVRLMPGDGEQMQAIVAWRDMVFVFKESKYFVFRQISVDGRGVATFYRQAVDVGIGAVSRKAVTVGHDGVYFVSRRGLMRTRGGDPEPICDELAPLFSGVVPFFYRGGLPSTLSSCSLVAVGRRLFFSYQSNLPGVSAVDRTWLIDLALGQEAVLTDLAAASGCSFRASETEDLIYARGATTVLRHHRGVSDDAVPYAGGAGSGFSSWWKGGWFAPFDEHVGRIRQMAIWGAGQVDVGLQRDYTEGGSLEALSLGGASDLWGDGLGADTWGGGTNAADTWGAGLAVAPGIARRAYKLGRASLVLSSVWQSGQSPRLPWSVSRAVLHVPNGGARPAAVLKA